MVLDSYKLKCLMEDNFLTLKALSEKTGVSKLTLQHAKAGQSVSMDTLKKICAALDCKPSDLRVDDRGGNE